MKVHSHPWFTLACALAIAHHNHFFKQYHVQGSLESKWLFHKESNLCKRVIEYSKQQYAASVAISRSTHRPGSREFWQIANSAINRNKSSVPPIFHWLEVVTSPLDKANHFSSRFVFSLSGIYIPDQVVSSRIHPSVSSFDLSGHTAWPIQLKFGSNIPLVSGNKNCEAHSGHKTLSRSNWSIL